MNQHNDQLPIGLLAQLVEHCFGVAEVMDKNPIKAWIFFRPYFLCCLSSVHYCEDHFQIQEYPYCISKSLLVGLLDSSMQVYHTYLKTFL